MTTTLTEPSPATEKKPDAIRELRALQRQRVYTMKSRNRIGNSLLGTVAQALFGPFATKEEFADGFTKAKAAIKDGVDNESLQIIIEGSQASFDAYDKSLTKIENMMVKMVKASFPAQVVEWVNHADQRGFGLLSLAVVIGEAGDLSAYPSPGKLWKRFGMAPYEHRGQHYQGATLKSMGKAPDQGWEDAGYSPRRRSIAFNIGDALLKGNKGPYRARYSGHKSRCYLLHSDWTTKAGKSSWKPCDKCEGPGSDCSVCGGCGMKCGHAHNRAMLVMTKMLFRELWIVWQQATDPAFVRRDWREVA